MTSKTWYPRSALTKVFIAVGAVWLFGGLMLLGSVWFANHNLVRVIHPGEIAPPFQLSDQDGRMHKLEDYRTRPLALAFLPDLGETSVIQLRSIEKASRQFDTLGVKVFAIIPTDAPTAKRVHEAEKLDFPILLDPGRRVARKYGVLPGDGEESRLSYVVGGDGRVLLPIATVHSADHGRQLVELAECCLDETPQQPSRLIGKPIEDFQLPRVTDGKPESLLGDRKQRLTVLFILSAECPCSQKNDARIVEMARRYSAKGVRFLALNASANEPIERVAEHARKAGFPFPVLKDEGNRIADRIEAKVTPEAFVLDAQGVLRYHGRIDDSRDPKMVQKHDLRNALDLLLAGKNPPRADVPAYGCAIYRAETAPGS